MDKMIAQPIAVTSCNPICVDDKLKYWNIKVTYVGNLRILYPSELPMEKFGYALNPLYVIPNRSHAIEAVAENGNTILTYSFDVAPLGIGTFFAQRFRNKIIKQINQIQK